MTTPRHPSATLHRVTFTVSLPRDPATHAARLRLVEQLLAGDDRVELFEDSTAPLPLDNQRLLTPGEFGWPEPQSDALGNPVVELSVLMHCPDTRLPGFSARVVLMHWVDGFRNLRLGMFRHEQSQEIRPQTGGLHHPNAIQARAAA